MYRCILCGQVMEGDACNDCRIEYRFDFPENSPFVNEILFLAENGEHLLLTALNNFIDEIDISISSTPNLHVPFVDDTFMIIDEKMKEIKDLLINIAQRVEENQPYSDLLEKLKIKDIEFKEVKKLLDDIKIKVQDEEFVRNDLKTKGIELEYIVEKYKQGF